MSSPSLPASFDAAVPARRFRNGPAWLREPLLHFLVLGAALFALDHAFVTRADDPHLIVIDAAADDEARQVFRAARGHDPDRTEMAALRGLWLNNEVLYREGLAMQVDRGDKAIRDRVIFKALSMVDANVSLPTPDDARLRQWFDRHRATYDEPARFDFQEAVLAGDGSEAAVRAFVAALNAGTPGDAKAGLRVYKARPGPNLDQSFGDGFAKTLEAATPGAWFPVSTRDGWRAVLLDAVTPPRPARFETVRNVVQLDWADATAAEQRTAAVAALARKYTVRIEAEQR